VEEGSANIEIANNCAESPMHAAIDLNSEVIVQYLAESIRMTYATNNRSGYALFCAIECQSAEMVAFLVKENLVNVQDTDSEGRTALHCAVSQDDASIVLFLVRGYRCT
jgi:ankyrin repeat protein